MDQAFVDDPFKILQNKKLVRAIGLYCGFCESFPGLKVGITMAALYDEGKICSFHILLYKRKGSLIELPLRCCNMLKWILSDPDEVGCNFPSPLRSQ